MAASLQQSRGGKSARAETTPEERPSRLGGAIEQYHKIRTTLEFNPVLRPALAAAYLGVSKITLWRLRTHPGFPQQIRITDSASGYRLRDLNDWLDQLATR